MITEINKPVNPQTHTFIKSSDGSILVGESPLEVLTWLARTHSDRIKLFTTFSKNVVKFMGAVVKTVEVSTGDYENFVTHLKETGWQLRPQVTSGGFVAVRSN
jgi:hypothetical protein